MLSSFHSRQLSRHLQGEGSWGAPQKTSERPAGPRFKPRTCQTRRDGPNGTNRWQISCRLVAKEPGNTITFGEHTQAPLSRTHNTHCGRRWRWTEVGWDGVGWGVMTCYHQAGLCWERRRQTELWSVISRKHCGVENSFLSAPSQSTPGDLPDRPCQCYRRALSPAS